MSPSSLLVPSPAPKPTDSRRAALSSLGLFVDRLIQTFEDRRPGLPDETVRFGEKACERFFLDIFEKERPRLADLVREQEHLSAEASGALLAEVERLFRTVVVPAYVRLATRFTPRERNDFYLSKETLHGLERVGWAVAGLALGGLVVWAPFIPLWSKEWVVPFTVAGFFYPNLRRWLAFKRYERDLNDLVARTDREVGRIDVAYLLSGAQRGASPVEKLEGAAPAPDAAKGRVH